MTVFPANTARSPNKKRGVIYVRVSTEEQRRHGYSLPSQTKLLRDKMKSDNVEEAHEPIIDAESGKDFERRGLKEIWELVHAKLIDYVYVYDLDRLGRHVAETPYLMWSLKESGVIVRDIKEEYDFDDPMDYVYVTMKCARAHAESDSIGERTQRGKNEKFAQGKWVGPVPFGYRKNAEGALEVLADLGIIVIDIFQTYEKIRDIKLTTQTINKKHSTKIGALSPNQVRTILTNPVYAGRPRYGKNQIMMDKVTIIDPKLYDEVQIIIQNKAKKHQTKDKKKTISKMYELVSDYGVDYVMKVLRLLRPHCPRCGSVMVHNGHKRVLDLNLPNFVCTRTNDKDCRYERTFPQASELKQFQKNLTRCPKCGVVEDFAKTETLGGPIEYTCRRCGTSFQFSNKESEKKDHASRNQINDGSTKSGPSPKKDNELNCSDSQMWTTKDAKESENNICRSPKKTREKTKERHCLERKNRTLDGFF